MIISLGILWIKLKLSVPNFQIKYRIFHKSQVFERASEDEIKKLIFSSSSCDLDPIPTSVLKNCLGILTTPITEIINISMETSTFPQNFKEAHVRPLLNKTYLPKNELKNYKKFHFQNLRIDSSQ